MALPQEPRQKMINLMYLVLTALLALNVSSEILNAFQVVDKSMQGSTKITNASTDQIMSSFKTKMNDPSSRANATIWMPKAQSAITLCQKAYDDIEAAKKQLLTMKDTSISKDNLEASTHIFVEEKGGEAIYDKMVQLQKDLWAIDPVIAKEFAEGLPIDFAKTDPDKTAWAYKSFHMMPTVAALTMLSKFQADVKTSENKIAAFCHSKVGEVVVKYDNFAALVGQSSSYLPPNSKIKITGGLGAYSSSNTPSVSINGQNVAVANGQGSTEFDAGGPGTHSANVTVTFKDQNGLTQTKTETVNWTVGQPGSSSVSADYMNVFYLGVPNKVSVGTSAGWDKTQVSWGGLSASGSQGNYMVTPQGGEREENITVTSNGTSSSFKFRIKRLPPASVTCAGQKSGAIGTNTLIAQGGVIAKLENSDFAAQYTVESYKVTVNGKNGYQEAQNNGNRWSGSAGTLISGLKPGSSVTFENIKVKGPDGLVRPASNEVISFICR
jgi:gliding motility-associated protein GldM